MGYSGEFCFSALTFTEAGEYHYTVKELTAADGQWQTDERAYRITVTVTQGADGSLAASVSYPDGTPLFVNEYNHPPHEPCEYFNCLPFPMMWFVPPQKPEFLQLKETSPAALHWWEEMEKILYNKNKGE
jgi:pilin isopeptide linkage protein